MAKEMIAMLLAGGQGSRLYALTQKLAKPAVPFGGKYLGGGIHQHGRQGKEHHLRLSGREILPGPGGDAGAGGDDFAAAAGL